MSSSLLSQINPLALQLPESSIRAVANVGMEQKEVIPLWFGESDIATPDFIQQAAFASLNQGQTLYTPNNGTPQLRQALLDYQTRLFQRPFALEQVVVTQSGTNAVMLAAQALLKPGDKVVVISPAYPILTAIPRLLGAEVVEFALNKINGEFVLDLEGLFATLAGAKALIINSPANPTSWVASLQQLKALVEFARREQIWIIADEVYNRHVYADVKVSGMEVSGSDSSTNSTSNTIATMNHAPSFCQLLTPEDPIIVCNSFSKAWSMTGWRLGWLTLPPVLRPTITKLMEFNVSCSPAFVQAAGVAALEQGEAFLQQSLERFAQSRKMVAEALSDIAGVTLYPMPATFYAFLQIEGLGHNSQPFIMDLMRQAKVGVAPGEAFGEAGRGHLRLCYGCHPERLAEALERLRHYLNAPILT